MVIARNHIMQRTLILLKPDAVQRRLVGTLIQRFEQKGLRLVGVKMVHPSQELAEKHYAVHKGKPFYESLLKFLTGNHHLDQLAELAKDPGGVQLFLDQHLPFHLRSTYGGNSTCLEIQTPDALLILDCGTGFRVLGMELERRWNAPGFRGSREAH